MFSEFCSISALSCSFEFVVVGGGWWVVPSDYFVSTQLKLWLFCCWGCGCCWAVTINQQKMRQSTTVKCFLKWYQMALMNLKCKNVKMYGPQTTLTNLSWEVSLYLGNKNPEPRGRCKAKGTYFRMTLKVTMYNIRY